MDGRLYGEMKIDKSSMRILEGLPGFCRDWFMNLKASNVTASTRNDYLYKARVFLRYINSDPKNVKPEDINESNVTEYFSTTSVKHTKTGVERTSDSYRAGIWKCLNSLLGYLAERNLIPMNYMTHIKKPKIRDGARIDEERILLTSGDFKKILKEVSYEQNRGLRRRDRAILEVFMCTGMRTTALANMMLQDLDLDNNTLTVIDKGEKRQDYILTPDVTEAIQLWLDVRYMFSDKTNDEYDHVFLSLRGMPMGRSIIADVVKKYAKVALGDKISPHKLRAGYCSILYDKTNDVEFVRRAVGHADVSTTQKYIVTEKDERKRAADMLSDIFS